MIILHFTSGGSVKLFQYKVCGDSISLEWFLEPTGLYYADDK